MSENTLTPVSSLGSKSLGWRRAGKRLGGLVAACGGVAGLVWVLFFGNQASWNEKLTLAIETPSGVVTSSGVRRYTLVDQQNSWLPDAKGVSTKSQGEAIPLEVAPGKWVFVLFGGSYHHSVLEPKPNGKGGLDVHGHVRALKATIGQPAVTTNSKGEPLRFPMVTFLDINDPTTARFIENGDLEPFFGPGYRTVSSTVEITDEPVTEGKVIQVLDWWMDYRAGPFNNMTYLKIPNNSPVGYTDLPARRFWSLDLLKNLDAQWESRHVSP